MIAFAALLERLVFTPSRNAKIALLRRYFATQPDPDRGIGLAVAGPAGKNSPELSVFTPDLTGTHDWTRVAADFTIFGAPRLVEVRIARRPTWDFDNHPHGTAWVDDVAIRRLR